MRVAVVLVAMIAWRGPCAVRAGEPDKARPTPQGRATAAPGPPRMPYVAVHDPVFVPASKAVFAHDADLVVGVARGKTAKAYMAADLWQHGSVDDQMPDGPIEVTWCGTCGTGAVFRAELNGRRLHFEYDSMMNANEVHRDVETGSRWQQSTGEAIDGPLKGSTLKLYDFVLTTWKEWRTRYPNTQVLQPMPGYLERMDVIRGFMTRSRTGEGAAPDGSFSKDDRLRPRELIAGLAVGNETMAFQIAALQKMHVVNERLGGVPIVVIHQPASETTTAYEARVKDRVLRFDAATPGATSVIDRETRSTWNAYGLATKGPLKGTQLKPLILIPEFWFAWSQFRPGTRLFSVAPKGGAEVTVPSHIQAIIWSCASASLSWPAPWLPPAPSAPKARWRRGRHSKSRR
jgi:uncharacterized protein DUF3179